VFCPFNGSAFPYEGNFFTKYLFPSVLGEDCWGVGAVGKDDGTVELGDEIDGILRTIRFFNALLTILFVIPFSIGIGWVKKNDITILLNKVDMCFSKLDLYLP
jgi:hypothetical protein